jgi:F0F1-type ATP synthase assembly protein I
MWAAAWRYGAVGIEIVVALLIGYFAGRWLDGQFGTAPWLTIVLTLCGLGAGVKAVVRVIKSVDLDKM